MKGPRAPRQQTSEMQTRIPYSSPSTTSWCCIRPYNSGDVGEKALTPSEVKFLVTQNVMAWRTYNFLKFVCICDISFTSEFVDWDLSLLQILSHINLHMRYYCPYFKVIKNGGYINNKHIQRNILTQAPHFTSEGMEILGKSK